MKNNPKIIQDVKTFVLVNMNINAINPSNPIIANKKFPKTSATKNVNKSNAAIVIYPSPNLLI